MTHTFVAGDCLTALCDYPEKSVNLIVTSPPYWKLRDYGVAGQLGPEPTPRAYADNLVVRLRSCRDVLADDGTLWLNLGDSYCGSPGNGRAEGGTAPHRTGAAKHGPGLKPKDMVGIPWLVALALRDDGWYLRQAIPWLKRNAISDSAGDRPGCAVEYVFLFSKSGEYFYDHEAIKLPLAPGSTDRFGYDFGGAKKLALREADRVGVGCRTRTLGQRDAPENRQRRNSDWFFESWQGLYDEGDGPLALVVNVKGFKGAHFAVFPQKLVEPMILAGTSAGGRCPACGLQWLRVVERQRVPTRTGAASKVNGRAAAEFGNRNPLRHVTATRTVGWQPGCACARPPVPAVVLDPFAGAGTVAVVCDALGRDSLNVELNPRYVAMARLRLVKERLKRSRRPAKSRRPRGG